MNRIVLTADAVIDPNGFRLTIADRHYTVFTEDIRKLADLELQLRFWRQCAEHAVVGWNKLEDKYEDLLARVRVLLKSEPQDPDNEAWRQLELFEDTREEWAPPVAEAAPPVQG